MSIVAAAEVVHRRAKTALQRVTLSRPVRLAIEDGLIAEGRTVLDYGCGHGGDIKRLRASGVECDGWDPVHRPSGKLAFADVVNLGYVVNVIEDRTERAGVLRRAWGLAKYALVVSGRLDGESRLEQGVVSGDGLVTRIGTFQKLFHQDELRNWIQQTLDHAAVAAGPGVFYVFRDDGVRQNFLAAKHRRWVMITRRHTEDVLLGKYQTEVESILEFARRRGRLPVADESVAFSVLVESLGSPKSVARAIRRIVDDASWEAAERARTEDLLIFLGLTRFDVRPMLTQLSADIQRDVRAFFTSYKAACELADSLLFAAGDPTAVAKLCRKSSVGKFTPTALYVHRSALHYLPPVLRLYEGCARGFIGEVRDANLIKLHHDKAAITYLEYPDFDRVAHPSLHRAVRVGLQSRSVEFRDYSRSANPPVLHRKEQMLAADHPLAPICARLTAREVDLGLFETPETIGTRDGWNVALAKAGVAIRGHRLVRGLGNRCPSPR